MLIYGPLAYLAAARQCNLCIAVAPQHRAQQIIRCAHTRYHIERNMPRAYCFGVYSHAPVRRELHARAHHAQYLLQHMNIFYARQVFQPAAFARQYTRRYYCKRSVFRSAYGYAAFQPFSAVYNVIRHYGLPFSFCSAPRPPVNDDSRSSRNSCRSSLRSLRQGTCPRMRAAPYRRNRGSGALQHRSA